MHDEARKFTVFVKGILPEFFTNKKVLDIGSGDINGNNRFLFDGCEYEGNDVINAPNVTVVSKTGALPFADNTFDTIISTECFEHDPEYKVSWKKAYAMLKPGGLFCFTCASTNRAEHGTRRSSPDSSYGTIGGLEDMSDYYKNLTEKDLHEVLDLNSSFVIWNTYYNIISCDLYFVGIKQAQHNLYTTPLPIYSTLGVAHTSTYIVKPYILSGLYPPINKDDWVFYEGCDSGGGDILHNSANSLEALFITASLLPGCIAFNTGGYMKRYIVLPLVKSASAQGIYIRKNLL
jgi:SAM-dependent methyltransferase